MASLFNSVLKTLAEAAPGRSQIERMRILAGIQSNPRRVTTASTLSDIARKVSAESPADLQPSKEQIADWEILDRQLGQKMYTPEFTHQYKVEDKNGNLIVGDAAAKTSSENYTDYSSWNVVNEKISKVVGQKFQETINDSKAVFTSVKFDGKKEASDIKDKNKKALQELRNMMK